MPLIARISATHTIREFRQAATLRYNEGRRLTIAGDRLAAIYLWGYTAEMLLKAAYFRLMLYGPTTPITMVDLQAARTYALGLGLAFGNLHDLPGWRALLIEEHRIRGSPYKSSFARSITTRVGRIHQHWREHLRYRKNRPYLGEVNQTLQNVTWLLSEYRSL
jgi:hypothetical protein